MVGTGTRLCVADQAFSHHFEFCALTSNSLSIEPTMLWFKPFLFKRCVAADGWVKVLRGRHPPSEQWPMDDEGGDREAQLWAVPSEPSGRAGQSQEPRSCSGCFGSRRLVRRSKFRQPSSAPRRVVRQCVSTRPRQSPRWNDFRKHWMHWAVLEDQRSTPSRELSRRLRRSHENDPSQTSSRSARSSSSVPPNASQS